jgi:hypothetical protein
MTERNEAERRNRALPPATEVEPIKDATRVVRVPTSSTHAMPAAVSQTSAVSARVAGPLASRARSHIRAAKAFENFNQSRFARDATPANYVASHEAKQPAAVQKKQKQLISQKLDTLPDTDPLNPGMTFAFSQAKLGEMQKMLPGLQKDGGQIQLDDLLNYMRGKMKGTNLYANGNPALRRLTIEPAFRTQAQAIVNSIRNRTGAAPTSPTATSISAPPSRSTKPSPKP